MVLPDNKRFDGELVNVFGLVRRSSILPRVLGLNVALIRSDDHGRSWSQKPIVFSGLPTIGITDPDDDSDLVRSADVVPDIAVDPNSGQLYTVWQDPLSAAASTTVSHSPPRRTAGSPGRNR